MINTMRTWWGKRAHATPKENWILTTCQGNKMYVDRRDQVISSQILNDGVHEEYETQLFRELVKPGMRIVIIGANIGYYTLIAGRLLEGRGWIYSFEPEPNNYELLVRNIELNGYQNITPIRKAASDKDDKVKLFLDSLNSGNGSFAEKNVEAHAGFVETETVALDPFFEKVVKDTRVDLMKIDAQGAEELVLRGAENIIKKNKLTIIIEFWPYGLRNVGTDPWHLLDELQGGGFKIRVIDKDNKRLEQTDVMQTIRAYERWLDGKGFVDLLLTRA